MKDITAKPAKVKVKSVKLEGSPTAALPWNALLNAARRKSDGRLSAAGDSDESRTEIERDYDRILFSTPVRRLADKTQVFPLEKNDSVRNRLTHSFEVSNLARSVGTTLAFKYDLAKGCSSALRDIPSLCAAAGLVHDLGNPPFGHQGESAIQSWFKDNERVLEHLNKQQKQDFLKFEGNAQGFRLVTRLQLLNDNFGLDLTYATLAAMMKYPVASNKTDKDHVAKKKHGFFAAEEKIANTVLDKVGLSFGKRHPVAYVMEACDDIAYVVFDAEDAIKKGLASISDLFACLKHEVRTKDDCVISKVLREGEEKHAEYRDRGDLSPAELNDVSMQRFRVSAISAMIRSSINTFVANENEFVAGASDRSLMACTDAERLRKSLKDFSLRHAYTHRSVLSIELSGYNVIRGLMDMFWAAIVDREDSSDPSSRRRLPFTRFVYSRISENYRRAFENPASDMLEFPMRYRECLLLTDMVSGMTDSYAMDLFTELRSFVGEFDFRAFVRQ